MEDTFSDANTNAAKNMLVIFDTTPYALGIVTDGLFVEANEAAVKIFHAKSKKDIIGKSPGVLSPEFQPNGGLSEELASGIIERCLAGAYEVFEWQHQTIDGKPFFARVNVRAFEYQGKPSLIVAYEDITEQKTREQGLLAAKDNIQTIFDTTPCAMLVVTDGVFIEANEAAVKIFHAKSKDDIIGKSPGVLSPEFQPNGGISEELASGIIERCLAGAYEVFEWQHKTIEGKPFLTRINVRAFEYKGKPSLIVAFEDITKRKKAEDALKESEERLRLTLDAIKDGIWDWNIPSGRVYFSPQWYTTLGYYPNEMPASYSTWQSLIHPDDLGGAEKRLHSHLTGTTEEYAVEIRMLTKQGEWRWILSRGNVILRDKEGNPVRMVGTQTDISERKKIEAELDKKHDKLLSSYEQIAANEEELRQNLFALNQSEKMLRISEERLSMAQGMAYVGSWEYNLETGKIWGSTEGFRIYGFPPVSGEVDLEIIEACIIKREEVHQAIMDLIKDNREYNLEYTIRPADGSPNRVVHSIGRLDKGNPSKIRGAVQDITDLKIKEESLIETNAYLENLIDSANVPIIVWDPTFKITRQNRAFELLTGRSAVEAVGKSLEILFPPSRIERSMELIHKALEGVKWETVEIEIQHTSGSIRTIIWNSSTIYSGDGSTPIAIIAQGQDITEQRRLEQEKNAAIEQVNHNLAQLATLNDGIRNPLTIIDTLLADIENPTIRDQIFKQTTRIDDMVTQLDKRWIESDKILNFLHKHYKISFTTQDIFG